MKRRNWMLWSGVGLAAGAAGIGWQFASSRAPTPSPADETLWNRRFDSPSGGEIALAEWRGKPLLLNFWATWCPPCVKEMPMLDAFQKTGSGLSVVGLAVDGPTPVREFLARLPVAFPIGLAGMDGAELARTLGNTTGGLPFSAVFDRDGRLHERKLGSIAATDLERWAKRLSAA